jgi:hypothetical protein
VVVVLWMEEGAVGHVLFSCLAQAFRPKGGLGTAGGLGGQAERRRWVLRRYPDALAARRCWLADHAGWLTGARPAFALRPSP